MIKLRLGDYEIASNISIRTTYDFPQTRQYHKKIDRIPNEEQYIRNHAIERERGE